MQGTWKLEFTSWPLSVSAWNHEINMHNSGDTGYQGRVLVSIIRILISILARLSAEYRGVGVHLRGLKVLSLPGPEYGDISGSRAGGSPELEHVEFPMSVSAPITSQQPSRGD